MREPLHDGLLDPSRVTPEERTAKLNQRQQGTSAQAADGRAQGAVEFSQNPPFVPFAWVRSNAQLLKSRSITRFAPLFKLLGTEKPQARLRTTQFRDVTSAAMLYDALPVRDVFGRDDASTGARLDGRTRRHAASLLPHRVESFV
jgi:hypothetical protein